MFTITADTALTDQGWQNDVQLTIIDGKIDAITTKPHHGDKTRSDAHVSILLPAPCNLHSHAFQRAMAGLTEFRGDHPEDSFWTWRQLMYRFLETLTPEDVRAIAALVQMEMLEAGYAAIGEFHYLHHQADGTPYDDLAVMAAAITDAAIETGIGMTLLPVLYQYGGCDKRPLGPGQIRFGNQIDQFYKLHDASKKLMKNLPEDACIGVAPHSLRAVSHDGLLAAVNMLPDAPLHMHLAEQVAEVDEVKAHTGARPTEWLLDQVDVNSRFCLIHSTQMIASETAALAKSGAVVGLCPITESSLGDGIFDGERYITQGGKFGVGSDSNIRISLVEELRTLEYSQRLRDKKRNIMASEQASVGRLLWEKVNMGGHQAMGRHGGLMRAGAWADLVALDHMALDLISLSDDRILDNLVTTGDKSMISDVWSAGRHMVVSGQHIHRDVITARYAKQVKHLRQMKLS
ncbi:MAG: formimidoylglutamate deiminase [Pseudomonadota bacterium]|nr:formimidoylglutamate deiminase [Pseudomonadota bacterium]